MSSSRAPERSTAPRAAATKFGRLTSSRPPFIWAGIGDVEEMPAAGDALRRGRLDRAACGHLHLQRERAVGDRVRAEQLVAGVAASRPATAPSPKLNMKRERALE